MVGERRLACRIRASILLSILPLAAVSGQGRDQPRALVYGLVPNSPPTTYVDASGTPTGFFIELYSRIMDDLHIDYEYRVGPFTELYPALVSGEIDFFTTLVKSPEREDLLLYPTIGAAAGWSQLFVALDTELESILDLQLKRIGVVTDDRNGSNFRTYIRSLAIPCEIVEYADFEKLVAAVRSGEVFGGVQSNWFVAAEKRVKPTTLVFAPFQAFPVLSRNSPLKPEFDAILGRYADLLADQDSYYYELQAEWLGHERTETAVVPAWLVAVLGTLLASSVASVVVIRLLTGKLRAANRDLELKVAERTGLLVRSEKLAALGTLVAGIAHEFNTPLHVIMSSLDALRSVGGSCGLGEAELDDARILLERRGEVADDSRADSMLRLRAVRERLASFPDIEGEAGELDRLAAAFSELGVLEPDAEAVRVLRRATPAMLAGVLDGMVRMDAFEVAAEAVDRMGGIIRALRIYAHRDQTREATVASLPLQLDSVLTLFSDRVYEGGIRVVADYAGLPAYRCFADQLQQVWMNVVGNAVEAMGRKGVLTIKGRLESGAVRVDISDTGPGIAPEHLDVVFEPFFTTKSDGAGTGLGLSISREIVINHRGDLSFTSGPEGTTFTVTLPAAGVVSAEPPLGIKEADDA